MELIKSIVKVGNSAGVILPREWLNGTAKIELVEKPANIERDIFDILSPYLTEVIGIYLSGSYARGEETRDSDIDVIVVTNSTNKKIIQGKYHIILISQEKIEKRLEENIIPILPMLTEANPLLNSQLIEKYINTKINKKNLGWYFEITRSSLAICKRFIDLDRDEGKTSDSIAYSLILNLRSSYIVDCLIKGRKWTTKDLKFLIKRVSGSLEAYKGYLRVKKKTNKQENLRIEEADQLYYFIIQKIEEHLKWAEKRN